MTNKSNCNDCGFSISSGLNCEYFPPLHDTEVQAYTALTKENHIKGLGVSRSGCLLTCKIGNYASLHPTSLLNINTCQSKLLSMCYSVLMIFATFSARIHCVVTITDFLLKNSTGTWNSISIPWGTAACIMGIYNYIVRKNSPLHIGGSVHCTVAVWESRTHVCTVGPSIV